MPEPAGLARRLGGLLPRRVRDALFTPALHDLRAEALQRGDTGGAARIVHALRVLLLFLDCLRVALVPASTPRPAGSRRPPSTRPELFSMMLTDVRQAASRLVRQPGFTAASVLTLALGIALSVAIFAVFEAVVLRPLPYPDGDEIVILNHRERATQATKQFIAAGDFADLVARRQALAELAMYQSMSMTVTGEGDPFRVPTLLVGPGMLDLLRFRPALGRAFQEAEHLEDAAPVIILGHRFWQEHFGADPAVVGRSVILQGEPRTVIGVAPEGFAFPPGATVDIVVPWWVFAEAPEQRKAAWYFAAGRLAPGHTAESATEDVARVAAWMEAEYPDQNVGSEYFVTPLRDQMVGNTKLALQLLLAAVLLVMLIACANVANLQLARALSRRKEISLQLALGSGWYRIVRQFLAESLVLAGLAGALGVTLATWGSRLLVALVPASIGAPGLDEVRLNGPVLAFAVGVAALAATVFGLASAAAVRAEGSGGALVTGGRASSGRAARRASATLVVAEVALALVLVIGTGLVMRTFDAVLAVDPGFRTEGVTYAQVSIPTDRYADPLARQAFHRTFTESLLAIPGVDAVGTAVVTPLTGNNWTAPFERMDQPVPPGERPPDVGWQTASGGWFEAMGVPLLSGRLFDERDGPDTPPVVIVSRSLEKRFFPEGSVIGHFVNVGGPEPAEIVGVVGDVRRASLTVAPREDLYLPVERNPQGQIGWFIHSTPADQPAVAAALRGALRSVEPDALLGSIRSMSERAQASAAVPNLLRWLLGVFSASALLLAATGIYGVTSYAVRQRTREIGTRMAVGATAGDILRMVLRDGASVAATGVALGLGVGLLASRALRSVLFGVSSADPLTLGTACALLFATALLASWLPARRAAALDAARTLSQP